MRGGRHVYKQFQNEYVDESGRPRPQRPFSSTCLKARPPPQNMECPKSPKEGLLIDFSGECSSISSPCRSKASGDKNEEGSLLDRSVSDYSQLPLPMGDKTETDDPFEVRVSVLGAPLTPTKAYISSVVCSPSHNSPPCEHPPNASPPPCPPPCPPRTYANLPCDVDIHMKSKKPLPSLP